MRKTTKTLGNYFVDRTYSDNVGTGKIAAKKSANKEIESRERFYPEEETKGQSFIKALISFRWHPVLGGIIVLTRQSETSDEAYELAVNLKSKMQKELLENKRFDNSLDDFREWIDQQIAILKQNGFHKLKG